MRALQTLLSLELSPALCEPSRPAASSFVNPLLVCQVASSSGSRAFCCSAMRFR